MKPFSIRAFAAAALCASSLPAFAQNGDVGPAPTAVPIGEIGEESISPAIGQTIEGMATVIDGDELRVGESMVRLFGIAAPEISSNLGPEARLYLDGMVGGQRVTCIEVDRTEEDISVAICSIDGTDLAPELLSQGLAAVYRVGAPPSPEERELAARYDTEEADARTRKIGIWAPRDAPPPAPTMLQTLLPKWIEQAPLLALIALLGIVALVLLARRPNGAAAVVEDEFDDKTLAATLLAEVSAIRDSAQEQYDGTATLLQDMPIPSSQQGLLGLPRAVMFGANADRLDLLPGEFATRLVRFYALHDGVSHLLRQAGNARCETVRAALHGLARSADETIAAG
ncbi:MAG: thermonuclease family protein [Dongiaceae bacterium]